MSVPGYVTVTITRDSVGVARAGFGVPLLLSYNAAWSGDRVRTYNSLIDVADDFATTTVEYMTAQQAFGQSPRLQSLKIARGDLPATQRYSIAVGTPVNSHVYTFNVLGEGFSQDGVVTAASDSSATNDEVVALIVTALNGVTGNNYTASAVGSVGSQTVQVVADAAGDWFAIEIARADIGNLTISQDHADPGVATDLAAIELEDPDWYFLLTSYNSKAYVAATAAAANALTKIYVFDANDTTCATVAVASADDTFEDSFDSAFGRVSGWYHPDPSEFLAASIVGRCAPLEPGSVTFAAKSLQGTDVVSLTGTHRANIVARNANSYERKKGTNLTFNGKVFSGEYIDVVRDLDFVDDDISSAILEVIAGVDKVPFTDEGIALVEGALRGALERAESKKIFAPGWTITVPKADDVSVGDKATRTLPDVKFSATLAGAIHAVEVVGVVSV